MLTTGTSFKVRVYTLCHHRPCINKYKQMKGNERTKKTLINDSLKPQLTTTIKAYGTPFGGNNGGDVDRWRWRSEMYITS